jgi:hypothetical protein
MSSATMTDAEWERDPDGALRLAQTMPVFMTENGTATHVLISAEEWLRINAASVESAGRGVVEEGG